MCLELSLGRGVGFGCCDGGKLEIGLGLEWVGIIGSDLVIFGNWGYGFGEFGQRGKILRDWYFEDFGVGTVE